MRDRTHTDSLEERSGRGVPEEENATTVDDLCRQLDETQRQLQQAQAANNTANFPNMKGGQPLKWTKTGEIPLTQLCLNGTDYAGRIRPLRPQKQPLSLYPDQK